MGLAPVDSPSSRFPMMWVSPESRALSSTSTLPLQVAVKAPWEVAKLPLLTSVWLTESSTVLAAPENSYFVVALVMFSSSGGDGSR